MIENERKLTGGNLSSVSTNGNIVYKGYQPQTATVQRLLRHLHRKGITFCPKALGLDNSGREMLSYVSGNTVEDYPMVSLLTEKINIVKQAATMLRKFHDATVDFKTEKNDVWFLQYNGDLPKEVICHNDFAPYNVTFENNLPIGLIDFDTACPAPRIWDIAYAVYRFVPLSKSVYDCALGRYRDYNAAVDGEERKILLRYFLNTYGYVGDIEEFLIQRLSALVNLFDTECVKGNPAFIRMKKEGHQDLYISEITFIKENLYNWR